MTCILRVALALAWLAGFGAAYAGAPKAGDVPPDVLLGTDMKGDPVRVSDFPGHIVVVSFWASWCGPCRKEIPIMENLEQFAEKNQLPLQVVAVNVEERETFWHIAPKLGSLHLKLVNERSQRSMKAYGVSGIPHMVIVGKDGRILAVHIGYGESSLDDIVDEINHALVAKNDASANSG